MRPFRPRAGVPAIALVLIPLLVHAGCAPLAQTAHEGPRTENRRLVNTGAQAERPDGRSGDRVLSASVARRDARGEPVPGLPRHPGSVRTGYSAKETDGLVLIRASYLSREKPDRVRGFYRDVFRAEGWEVANVEYSGGGWHFLVLKGRREAAIDVRPRDGGSGVRVELSRPSGGAQESWASAGGSKR